MSDLRERLADAAGATRPVDVADVRRRGHTLRRRRIMMRVAAPSMAIAVAMLGIAFVVRGDDDASPVLTDRPSVTSTSIPVTTTVPTGSPIAGEDAATSPTTASTTSTTSGTASLDRTIGFTDPRGDTRIDNPWSTSGTTDDEPSLDVLAGSLTVGADSVEAILRVVDLSKYPPKGADGASYAWTFTIWDDGEQLASQIIVQRFNDVEESQVVVFADLEQCTDCTFQFDEAASEVRARVPFEVFDRLLHRQGFNGLSRGDRFAGPGAETKWTRTNSTTPHAQDQPAGPYFYGSGTADKAAGPGKSVTL